METLDQLGLKHGTDQASSYHGYCDTMDEFLSPRRHDPVVVMEQGVLGGAGLRMWAEYFDHPDSRIIGVDPHTFDRKPIEDKRVVVFQGSQCDWPLMVNIRQEYGEFDWVTDDASHFARAQQEAFGIIWPMIKPGGFWCCQDLHSYAAPELCDAPENVMQWLTRIATQMQGRGAQDSGKVNATDRWASIDLMTFRKGMVVLRKSHGQPPQA